ncbi:MULTISPECIES: MarR family winged helix-turn-helix transcriptional regulator [Pandoraea]|jgi:DNA-binding MarR family transcriptional regulator|uniref:MarR family winged helix-turn-helix transcriptional regulator n=1 Tax=Pandoraea TaxID=93217 RepID=UPI0003D213D9|nr:MULTISPECIES: MarR family winged helix-turn-helix transcriptional regulator [Pandoraea]QDH58429.1 winged helix-turn-helix transcriptional regulator [Pandoraea pnomenusa]
MSAVSAVSAGDPGKGKVSEEAADRRLYFLLTVGQRRVQRWIDARAGDSASVSAAQAGVLFYLLRHEDALVGEVGAALQLSPSSMTGLANRMVGAGLLARRADAEDGRATRLRITAAGHKAVARARDILAELNALLHDDFTEAELKIVARWLSNLQNRFPADL